MSFQADELDIKLRRIIDEVPDNEYSRMGSNAGANSKTFDQYRFAKQRELERVRKMEAEAVAEEKKRQFQVRACLCCCCSGGGCGKQGNMACAGCVGKEEC